MITKILTVLAYILLGTETILALVIIVGLYSGMNINLVECLAWWFCGIGLVTAAIATVSIELEQRAGPFDQTTT